MEVAVEEGRASAHQEDPQRSGIPQDSQTASDFINSQLQLEADAREVLPYAFDSCSQPLGPLRQTIFACTTCNPPPASPAQLYFPAGICYSCSIACHGDHTLVELFSRRNFVCDCGSTRMPTSSPCTLRSDPVLGTKGVHSQEAARGNHYNHNFQNRFCGCGEEYNAFEEKGTMYQCLGLGTVETGGCGEDWWHPECLMGLSRDWRTRNKSLADQAKEQQNGSTTAEGLESDEDHLAPPGFPKEDDFETLLCYKCVDANPWIKQYAGAVGFLPPLFKRNEASTSTTGLESVNLEARGVDTETCSAPPESKKRKALEEDDSRSSSPSKRAKEDPKQESRVKDLQGRGSVDKLSQKHDILSSPPAGTFSLLLKENFRDHICHCPECYPHLIPHPQLREAEDIYQPPVSESEESNGVPGSGARSHGTGSLLERGEAALGTMDRVKAIEGVMVYNHLKDKVKDFLKPYAESGTAVGAEDIKAYFEKLRGDDAAIREARTKPGSGDDDKENDGGTNHRREQSGY